MHLSRNPDAPPTLRLLAWEMTRSCNLSCRHCRASAEHGPYTGELSTEEGKRLLNEIAALSPPSGGPASAHPPGFHPVVILTGGEPLLREDLYDLASWGTHLGLRMVMATNGILLTPEVVTRLKEAGIQRVSISLDAADQEKHDHFRQVRGAFEGALQGIALLKEGGLEFQINTTVTTWNSMELPAILEKAIDMGAAAHHIFLLVPTGRGRDLGEQELSPEQYEQTLRWLSGIRDQGRISIKATCAPHFYRIIRQEAHARGEPFTPQTQGLDAVTRGCLGGTAFCFVSHRGEVQPCGYLELMCGQVRDQGFKAVWESSPHLKRLRDFNAYEGKCGACEYLKVCGGCRARAYADTGNYMAEEPLCTYQPHQRDIKGGL